MSFIAKFIPDPMMITDDMGASDGLGYYDILFSFSSVQEIIEKEPQQVVCSYTLQLGDVILNYRFNTPVPITAAMLPRRPQKRL